MNQKYSLTALLTVVLMSSGWTQPTTVVLQEGLNSYAGYTDKELRDPSKNYGTGPTEAILKISEYCPACPYARAALHFDVSTIPSNATITTATLEFYAVSYSGGSQTGDYSIYKLTRGWSENDATWQAAVTGVNWANPGGDYATKVIAKATCPRSNGVGWIKYNVLEVVKEFVQNPATNFGILIKNSSGAQEIDFSSSEAAKSEQRPKLTITYETPSVGLRQNSTASFLPGTLKANVHLNNLQIDWDQPSPISVSVARLNGVCIFKGSVTSGRSITVSGLTAGVYSITAGSGNMQHSMLSVLH